MGSVSGFNELDRHPLYSAERDWRLTHHRHVSAIHIFNNPRKRDALIFCGVFIQVEECKVYENGRGVAGPETLRQLAGFSERQIREETGVRRDTIRAMRHGKGVKRSTYEKVINFLRGADASTYRANVNKTGIRFFL